VGFNGYIPGVAHHTAPDQTEAKLVLDFYADLVGRCAHCAVHNMLVRAQQLMPGDDRDASVLR